MTPLVVVATTVVAYPIVLAAIGWWVGMIERSERDIEWRDRE